MASDDDPRPDGPQLSAARARLCALLPQLSEREGEALLGIAAPDVHRAGDSATARDEGERTARADPRRPCARAASGPACAGQEQHGGAPAG
jgi:hypothetical protein